MCCTIENATNVYCGCSCDEGTLYNPSNSARIVKNDISQYIPVDIVGPPAVYNIDFFMKSMSNPFQQWTFTSMTARDAALANIDIEMKTVTV